MQSFPPPMIPQNPNHFAHCGNPPKTQKQKKDIAKSLISGGPFPEKHQNSAKKKDGKTPLAVRDERNERAKNQVSLAGTSRTNPCEPGTDDSDISSNSNPSALRRSNQQPIATARSTSSPTHPEPNQVITHVEPSGAHTLHISIFRASARARGVGDAVVAVEAGG